jgi:hypothetical protein
MGKVDVEIGAKTAGFSAGLARMGKDWDRFRAHVGKKMSLADLGKGLMMGLGIGSVQQIGNLFSGVFQSAADAARLMAERTAATLQTQQQLLALRQTPAQQIAATEKDMRGQEQAIERQKKLIADLDNPIMRALNDQWAGEFNTANQELTQMEAKLGASRVAVAQLRIEERKRQQGLRDTGAEISDQRELLNEQTTEVGIAERAASRAFRRMMENRGQPGGEERGLDFQKAELDLARAKKARELAQLRGIKADGLARIGGGGGVYAPGGGRPETNPAQSLVAESRKHTTLLQSIDGKLIAVRFTSPSTTLK